MVLSELIVGQVVKSIWKKLLDLDLVQIHVPSSSGMEGTCLETHVQLKGEWNGTVMMECSPRLAHAVASIMFVKNLDSVTSSDVHDALGELVNITAGNVRTLVDRPCEASMPTVNEGQDFNMRVPDAHIVSKIYFDCQGEPLRLTVCGMDYNPLPSNPVESEDTGRHGTSD